MNNANPIPRHLEEVFLRRGPEVLEALVDRTGGLVEASEIMGVSKATVRIWTRRPPGPSGSRGTRSHHSVWVGYPSPLPLLDRVVERSEEYRDKSYIEALVHRNVELGELLIAWREDRVRLGLRSVMSSEEARRIGVACKIPPSTLELVLSRVRWPPSWRALDLLAKNDGWNGFIEAVLEMKMVRERAPIEPGALSALCGHLLG